MGNEMKYDTKWNEKLIDIWSEMTNEKQNKEIFPQFLE